MDVTGSGGVDLLYDGNRISRDGDAQSGRSDSGGEHRPRWPLALARWASTLSHTTPSRGVRSWCGRPVILIRFARELYDMDGAGGVPRGPSGDAGLRPRKRKRLWDDPAPQLHLHRRASWRDGRDQLSRDLLQRVGLLSISIRAGRARCTALRPADPERRCAPRAKIPHPFAGVPEVVPLAGELRSSARSLRRFTRPTMSTSTLPVQPKVNIPEMAMIGASIFQAFGRITEP